VALKALHVATLESALSPRPSDKRVIRVANDVGVTKRNMHFERAAHYVRHAVMHNRVQLVWVDTKMQMADFHSKVVDSTSFFINRDYHLHS
jgi:hypothetical protein